MLRRRSLVCERCGAAQDAVGRVIEDAEREISFRWCRKCLDEHGPCATAQPEEQGEALGIQSFFSGLAEHLKAQVAGQVARLRFEPGDVVVYSGSKTADHGPGVVIEDRGSTVRVQLRSKVIDCNSMSLEPATPELAALVKDAVAAKAKAKAAAAAVAASASSMHVPVARRGDGTIFAAPPVVPVMVKPARKAPAKRQPVSKTPAAGQPKIGARKVYRGSVKKHAGRSVTVVGLLYADMVRVCSSTGAVFECSWRELAPMPRGA